MIGTLRRGREMSLHWTANRQQITIGPESFVNDGPTNVNASHDLAHLLIAATTKLEWNPQGSPDHARLAEYNAVLLETLFYRIGYLVRDGYRPDPSVLGATLRRMRWFVYKHYHPFPMEAEEAFCRFCCSVAPERIVRLSPLFFDLWFEEIAEENPQARDWALSFNEHATPVTSDLTKRCQETVARLMHSITRHAK